MEVLAEDTIMGPSPESDSGASRLGDSPEGDSYSRRSQQLTQDAVMLTTVGAIAVRGNEEDPSSINEQAS